jgi:prophage regulatory protein
MERHNMSSLQDSNFDKLPEAGFVRQSQLIPGIVPISSATFWRMVKSKSFPAPVKLSGRVTAWRVADVRAWLESRKEAA